MNINTVNLKVLAYLGDCVYENLVREYLISQKINNVNDLQKHSLTFVTAKSQSKILEELQNIKFLKEDEEDIVRRARNTKVVSHSKACDILTYKHSTAFEALFGYLKLSKKEDRIEEIFNKIKELNNVSIE